MRCLIPYPVEVLIRFLNDRDDRIGRFRCSTCPFPFPDGISREIPAVLRERVRLYADGAAVDIAIQHDDVARQVLDRVRVHVFRYLPFIDVGSRLDHADVLAYALHRRVEHADGMLRRLSPHLVSRPDVERAYSQHEDRHSHQQYAEAQLP